VTITGGVSGTGVVSGGAVNIVGADSPGTTPGGDVNLTGGSSVNGTGGDIEIKGGTSQGYNDLGGSVLIESGKVTGSQTTYRIGSITIQTPDATSTSHNAQGGPIAITAGNNGTRGAHGPNVTITAGDTRGYGSYDGGRVILNGGDVPANGGASSEGGHIDLNPGTATAVGGSQGYVRVLSGDIEMGSGGPRIITGSGTPESAVTAPIGSLYLRTDGGSGTTLYVKESGTGNTGWVAK
jgi:hypothetical protein